MLNTCTTIARSPAEVAKLASVWERIRSARSSTMFQSHSWNYLAAERFLDRLDPLVVAVESAYGAAIIPTAINRATGCIELLGEALFDYRDVLHEGNPELLRSAWQSIAGFGRPMAVTAIEQKSAEGSWRDFPLQFFANAPEVLRNLTTEQQFRYEHRRLERQLERIQTNGAMLRVYTGEDCALVRYLYTSKCEQFPRDESNIFRDPVRRQFMVDAAVTESKRCEMFILQTEDEILVAGLLTFRDGNWRRFYTIYFDPAWAAYSPGILLVYEATARSLAEGLNCDYMTGEYPYKLRFANSSRPLFRVEVTAEDLAAISRNMPVISSAA